MTIAASGVGRPPVPPSARTSPRGPVRQHHHHRQHRLDRHRQAHPVVRLASLQARPRSRPATVWRRSAVSRSRRPGTYTITASDTTNAGVTSADHQQLHRDAGRTDPAGRQRPAGVHHGRGHRQPERDPRGSVQQRGHLGHRLHRHCRLSRSRRPASPAGRPRLPRRRRGQLQRPPDHQDRDLHDHGVGHHPHRRQHGEHQLVRRQPGCREQARRHDPAGELHLRRWHRRDGRVRRGPVRQRRSRAAPARPTPSA